MVPPPPSVAGYPPPGQKLQRDDSAAVWLQPTERDSSHDSLVSSTSNLPSSAAQESDAASVLLYQSSNSGKDPRLWNVQEVTGFMYSIGCSNYADAFIKEVCLTCSHYCLCIVPAIPAKSWKWLCFLQRSLQFATKTLQENFISGFVVLEIWFMPYVNWEVWLGQPGVRNSMIHS